jgi:archaemetzincin
MRPKLPSDGAIIVGITANDLTPGGRYRGIENAFGWSSFYGRSAIVSTARVTPMSLRRPATLGELEHILKLALHETAHAFGLKHCSRHECIINGRCSLEENGRKPLWLCPECHAKLMYAIGFDPLARARQLESLCRRYGLMTEAAHYRKMFTVLGR